MSVNINLAILVSFIWFAWKKAIAALVSYGRGVVAASTATSAHTLVLLRANIHAKKKINPKPISATNESQGNGCPRAAARRVWLE
jgi:hypothetical protein